MDCKSLNQRGLFPGPEETEEEFKARVRTLKGARADGEERPRSLVEALFGISPDWIPVEYSNEGLKPWEGAATWFEKGSVRIQLRNGFKKGVYLGMYRRDEVLAHELVHLARMAFEEPKYEEVFAYLTSKSKFRRLLGALFRRPIESTLFVITAFFPLVGVVMGSAEWFPVLWSIPLVYFSYLTARLTFAQTGLNRCMKVLGGLVESPLAAALRLTDQEITQFSKMRPEEVRAFVKQQTSFRWNFLKQSAFAGAMRES